MGRTRGSITKRGDSWRVIVYIGTTADGKRQYRRSTVKGNRRAAQRELTKLLRGLDDGTLPPSSTRETLGAYLDRWLEIKRTSISARTAEGYTDHLAEYVRPTLANRRLTSLTPLDVQAIYDAMTKRGLTGGTVHKTHTALNQALAQAVAWRLLPFNPCDAVNLPRQQQGASAALSAEEARALLK